MCTIIATYANIQIYFCNIPMKHLKHTYETFETLETCAHNMKGARGRAIPTVGVGADTARAPLPPPSLVAPGLVHPGERRAQQVGASDAGWERDGRERAARDGHGSSEAD
jgi:hypothetical protein